MSTGTHTAVAEYVARIQTALADLPAAEVEEIVEDVGQHLSEVADELGDVVSVEALTDQLGPPEQYASELRAAAGYPPAGDVQPAKRDTFAARAALWGLVSGGAGAVVAGGSAGAMELSQAFGLVVLLAFPLLAGIAFIASGTAPMSRIVSLPEYRAAGQAWRRTLGALPAPAADYVRSLRPAWWLIRLLVLVIAILVALRYSEGETALALLAALAVLLLFGKRARTDSRWRWIIGPANIFTVCVGLALALTVSERSNVGYTGYTTEYFPPDGMYNQGSEVVNIYPFGPDGKPLPEVYLYDQDGQPISRYELKCDQSGEDSNRFPQARIEEDSSGCRELTDVPFTVSIPRASGTPSTPPATTVSPPPSNTTVSPPPSK